MIDVVGVSFSRAGKMYYFKPTEEPLAVGDHVLADTEKGLIVARVVQAPKKVPLEEVVLPLKDIIRKMTDNDWEQLKKLAREEEEAIRTCEEQVRENGLHMKIIGAQYAFDKAYLMFFFSADGRVDFRKLVKDLAKVFRTRIELRQIGVRDVAKMLGGLGTCGRELCCKTWLREFDSISIKMSKAQYMSINPNKMSGLCGRLMCCLRYEEGMYEDLANEFPDIDARVATPNGDGIVKNINVFTKQVFVLLDSGAEELIDSVDVKIISTEGAQKINEIIEVQDKEGNGNGA